MERQPHSYGESESSNSPQSDQKFLTECFNSLSSLSFCPSEDMARKAWIRSVAEILQQVGRDRLKVAIRRCLSEMTEFPKPVQVRAMVPERQKTEHCGKCVEGFLYGQNSRGDAVCYPCPCHPRKW